MHERAFVLMPLLELTPDLVIPAHGRADWLLALCASQDVRRVQAQAHRAAGGLA